MGELLQLTLNPATSELRRCSLAARAFLQGRQLTNAEVYLVDLALEEMVGNVMRYSGCRSPIDVGLNLQSGQIELTIEDDGAEFDPTGYPEPVIPRTAGEANVGGFGIHMVRSSVEAMHYARAGDRNRLVLHIRRRPHRHS